MEDKQPIPPTCEELMNGDGFNSVWRETDDSWRHGCYVAEVFHRLSDNTYWQAAYERSTDGETHGLREGTADIDQVDPYSATTTCYRGLDKRPDPKTALILVAYLVCR